MHSVLHWPLRRPHTQVAVLAHRGGRGNSRENTLPAFAEGLAAGADGIELDVRRSADGVAVVHHDEVLPGGGAVSELRADQLPPWLPTLAEALAACAGVVVDVEVKGSAADPGHGPDGTLAAEVAAIVRAAVDGPAPPAAVLVSCFWPDTLQAVRSADPELPTGLLVHPALDPMALLADARALGCTALLPFRAQLGRPLVDAAHQAGLAVVGWTLDDGAELRAAADAGVDGIVTDRVREALEALGRR